MKLDGCLRLVVHPNGDDVVIFDYHANDIQLDTYL